MATDATNDQQLQHTTAPNNALAVQRPSSTVLIAKLAIAATSPEPGDEEQAALIEEAQNEINEFCAALTPVMAMDPDNLQLSVLRKQDVALYRKAIALALLRLTEGLNVTNTLTDNQISKLTTTIGQTYYYLRFEELLYIFEKGASGGYGKDFNRLDGSVIMQWIEQYDVEERTDQAIALAQQRQGPKPEPLTDDQLKEFYRKAGLKVENAFVDNSHKRQAERDREADQGYQAFRRQYLQNQQAAQSEAPATDPYDNTDSPI